MNAPNHAESYAEILLGIPIRAPLTYSIPAAFQNRLKVGSRVWVPFRKSKQVGYCVGVSDRATFPYLKPILSVIDSEPILTPALLKLTRWMSETYGAAWGECIETALPGTVRRGRTHMRVVRVRESDFLPPPESPLALTEHQDQAFEKIREFIREGRHQAFLLHGVTASGKTEVYLQALAQALAQGKSGLILVPEIALIPQTVDHFRARFGPSVSVYHSRLSAGERFRVWQGARLGSVRVVVGTRSALFLPVERLGLIVVDEEHETAYKQEESPRYHAREAAVERARIEGAVLILGSATPSLEAYRRAQRKEYALMPLPKRLEERELPRAEIVDMRREPRMGGRLPVLSARLTEAVRKALEAGEGILLFINRRGFASHAACRICGWSARCARCDVSLVYHAKEKRLTCHYCGFDEEPPELCPNCRKGYVAFFGIGTEKVVSELARLFPQEKIVRMDRDTTARKGAHREIYEAFKSGSIHVLVGTQMIAKGLHFPQVSLVGVISADTMLNIPDFRAGERTFQLILQVAGRAGRGAVPGRVFIQTFNPEHPIVQAAAGHSYTGFADYELKERKAAGYPPYTRLANFIFRGRREEGVVRAAQDFARKLNAQTKRGKSGVEILGPAPMPIARLRRQYRWHVLIKSRHAGQWGKDFWEKARSSTGRGVRAVLDVDPVSML
ncbi:MAG: primosomal protein N' [Candidatus Omnitrophica bacterium]|nr:primosomal protein N' [Candidatus Omnitrophota bacterium]